MNGSRPNDRLLDTKSGALTVHRKERSIRSFTFSCFRHIPRFLVLDFAGSSTFVYYCPTRTSLQFHGIAYFLDLTHNCASHIPSYVFVCLFRIAPFYTSPSVYELYVQHYLSCQIPHMLLHHGVVNGLTLSVSLKKAYEVARSVVASS